MRLIDADALIKEYPQASGLKLVIENAPTAYDVEKVVAELEECSDKYKSSSCEYEQGKAFSYKNAIDIVRKGGVE